MATNAAFHSLLKKNRPKVTKKVRNPNSRNPNEIRIPKIEIRNRDSRWYFSDFGLLSAFGFRFSDFIRPPARQTDSGFRPPPRRDRRRCPQFRRGALRGSVAAGD